MRVLYYQSSKLDGEDFLYVDGKLDTNANSKGAKLQSDLLTKVVKNQRPPWVTRVDGYYIMSGNLTSKDEAGRTMGFLYCANKVGRKEFKQSLIDDLKSAGISHDARTEDVLNKYIDKGRNELLIIAILAAIILVAIFSILTTGTNSTL